MSNKEDIAKKHTTRVMLDRLVQDGGVEDMCSLFLMSTPESQLIAEQSLTKKTHTHIHIQYKPKTN